MHCKGCVAPVRIVTYNLQSVRRCNLSSACNCASLSLTVVSGAKQCQPLQDTSLYKIRELMVLWSRIVFVCKYNITLISHSGIVLYLESFLLFVLDRYFLINVRQRIICVSIVLSFFTETSQRWQCCQQKGMSRYWKPFLHQVFEWQSKCVVLLESCIYIPNKQLGLNKNINVKSLSPPLTLFFFVLLASSFSRTVTSSISLITHHSIEKWCLGDCTLGEGMYPQCITNDHF